MLCASRLSVKRRPPFGPKGQPFVQPGPSALGMIAKVLTLGPRGRSFVELPARWAFSTLISQTNPGPAGPAGRIACPLGLMPLSPHKKLQPCNQRFEADQNAHQLFDPHARSLLRHFDPHSKIIAAPRHIQPKKVADSCSGFLARTCHNAAWLMWTGTIARNKGERGHTYIDRHSHSPNASILVDGRS